MKRLTQEEFIERSKAVWSDRWNYDRTAYERMANPVTITCRLHGDFTHGPQAHLKGLVGCGDCNGQKPIDLKEFLKRIEAKGYYELYDFSSVIINMGGVHQSITVLCLAHNKFFVDSMWAFLNSRPAAGCDLCGKSKRVTQDILQYKASIVYPKGKYDYSLVNYSNGVKSKVQIICNYDDHGLFSQTIDNHLSGREGCPICARDSRLLPLIDFVERGKELWGDTVDYSKLQSIDGVNEELELICVEHGPFNYTPFKHLQGLQGCKWCRNSKGFSKGELEFGDFIETLGVKIIRNDRKILKGKEIDIYCPELSIGFEYNGLYYHSDKFLHKNAHEEKYKLAKEVGVRLYQFWENDWRFKKDILKRLIENIFEVRSIEACETSESANLKLIEESVAREFLSTYSLRVFEKSDHYVGLYSLEKELIAVALFQRCGNSSFEFKLYCSIAGNYSANHEKFVEFFENNFEYEALFACADLMMGEDFLYTAHCWLVDSSLGPEKFVVMGGNRLEINELSIEYKQYVYDAGKIRFVRPHPKI